MCVCKHSYTVCCRMSDGGNMQITYTFIYVMLYTIQNVYAYICTSYINNRIRCFNSKLTEFNP